MYAFVSVGSEDDGRRRGRRPGLAHVAAARVRRHAHLLPLRLPHRVRALIILTLVPHPLTHVSLVHSHVCSVMVRSVVNEPLESISTDLGFAGNTLAEGTTTSPSNSVPLIGHSVRE